ncbi:hypothetical protein IWW39_001593 [Coemansia spiralis]|uniref:Peptidase S54 rhomboid domain-containing protein n=1 Tax=Coemansia spiralis TaxID=417178 RepID=A0A9W8L5Z6_9FUNG|nr:hypothetical protein IWW39_001593 [Coemansia spiralis]
MSFHPKPAFANFNEDRDIDTRDQSGGLTPEEAREFVVRSVLYGHDFDGAPFNAGTTLIFVDLRHLNTSEKRSQHQHQFEPCVGASIIRPILWAAAFTACAYYATTETAVYNLLKPKPPTSGDSKARNNSRDARKTDVEALSIDAIYTAAKASASSVFAAFKNQCKTLTRGEYHVYRILALNTVVFFMWRSRRLAPFMRRHFVHEPRSTRSYTLLTSIFGHREYWHLLISGTIILSLSSHMAGMGCPEHFTFSYLSTGVLANLAAHMTMVLSRRDKLQAVKSNK